MPGTPAVPASEDVNTSAPRLRSSIPGSTRRVSTIGASRFTRVALRTSSGSIVATGSTVSIPALLTSTSIGPWASSMAAISPSTTAGSDRSATWATPPTSSATARRSSPDRATTTTFDPTAANDRARHAPIPREPPVTSTRAPSSSMRRP